MPKSKKWIVSRKRETFYKKAKSEGYSSRAAYKLMHLDNKYHVIKDGTEILDLCCAPGSWTEYVVRTYPNSRVIGVDLYGTSRLNRFENALFIRKNIFDDDLLDILQEKIGKKPPWLSSVLSDCAPKFSGAKECDLFKQYELCLRVLEITEKTLLPGGSLVLKSFQGLPNESRHLQDKINKLFRFVYKSKPKSSIDKSAEFYYVGLKRKKTNTI
ncbi:MAG: SAM-dependent methyltransferase [Promethearchaeota archaeon]